MRKNWPIPILGLLIYGSLFYISLIGERSRPAHAAGASLIDCVKAEAQRNFSSFADYQCDLVSYRKAWQMDGKLDRDNVMKKRWYVKRPNKKKEVFVSGTVNGQPAKEGEFIFEKLGLDSSTSFYDIECFRPGNENNFKLGEGGPAAVEGQTFRVLNLESLAPAKTNLIRGKMYLPVDSCRVARMEGRFLHRAIQKNEVDFKAVFTMVGTNLWLPKEMTIEGQVKMGWMKRKIYSRNEFSNYQINVGLADSLFK